jgi:flagellar hook-length control protein FliK
MQALSMIDTNMNVTEAPVPVKSTETKGKNFGTVMKEQRQAEANPKVQSEQQTVQKQDVGQEKNALVGEAKQPETQVVSNTITSEQVAVVAEPEIKGKAEPKLQQTVVQLMKVIAGGESSQAAEEFGSMEELLNRLVKQLEGADLEGEQVLAGIDLSALVEQLPVAADKDGKASLVQFVEQLEQQLTSDQDLLINTELVGATLLNEDPQAVVPNAIENLAQARQILQKAIDAVGTTTQAPVEESSAAVTEVQNEGLLLTGNAVEEIDPRFAGLLKPRMEAAQPQPGLRQKMQNETVATPVAPAVAGQSVAEVVSEQPETADFAELLNQGSKGFEKLAQQAQGQVQPGLSQVQNGSVRVAPQTPMVQLPSGQQIAESQIFDQVVTHISGSQNGDTGRMVLRLQPAELGSLKLELVVEGDRVKANLHAQTMQVQEVIERNLPQLRNALAEQGLKIDQFQVNVDQRQQGSQFGNQAQQDRQQGSSQSQDWSQGLDVEDQTIPLAHLMQNGGGGISLHV